MTDGKTQGKKRGRPVKVPEPEEKKPERVAPKITLAQWFAQALAQGKVREWQYNTLKLFASKRGLSDLETADKYDEMFKIF